MTAAVGRLDLSAIGAALSAVAAVITIFVAYGIHRSQRRFTQKQLLPELWKQITVLRGIDPAHPVTPDVVRAANTLELVAVCTESELVDAKLVRRIFRDGFMRMYEQIEACDKLPGLQRDGKQILKENRAATQFYQELKAEDLGRDKH